MIRLAIVTAVLVVALVVVKRRGRRTGPSETLRVTSRTGISRGVLAAVLEVEQRRFLVTITATSTTLVAELGHEPAAAFAVDDVRVAPAAITSAPSTTDLGLPADATFLERIRARTQRTYDVALVGPAEGGR